MPSDVDLLGDAPVATEAPVETVPGESAVAEVSETPVAETPATEAAPAETAETVPGAEEDDLLAPETAAEDPLTVKALNEKLAKSPEFQAALAKDPGLRNLLYATARQAQQAAQFKEIFQTPSMAKTALDLANKHIEFESAVQGTPDKALDAVYALTAPRDAQGNILWDQPNPAYASFMVHQRESGLWPYLVQQAADSKNEDWRDAVAIVAHQMLGEKIQTDSPFAKADPNKPAPQAPAQDPDTVARLARLDELERNQQTQQQEHAAQYQQAVVSGIGESITKATGSYLDNLLKVKPNVVVTEFIKSVVIEKSVQEIYELAKNDVSYKNHINFLFRSASAKDDALKSKLIAEATKYARERLPRVIAKHIGEASKGVVASQQQRLEKQTTQAQRPEVQGTAGVPTPSRQDPAERVKEFIGKHKRKPTDRELLDL